MHSFTAVSGVAFPWRPGRTFHETAAPTANRGRRAPGNFRSSVAASAGAPQKSKAPSTPAELSRFAESRAGARGRGASGREDTTATALGGRSFVTIARLARAGRSAWLVRLPTDRRRGLQCLQPRRSSVPAARVSLHPASFAVAGIRDSSTRAGEVGRVASSCRCSKIQGQLSILSSTALKMVGLMVSPGRHVTR